MKKFTATFYRGLNESEKARGEVGPVVEHESVECLTKKRANEWARTLAKERGWRLTDLVLVSPEVAGR